MGHQHRNLAGISFDHFVRTRDEVRWHFKSNPLAPQWHAPLLKVRV